MSDLPSEDQLPAARASAGNAHHDYEKNFLSGKPDEHWAGWYAAHVLGRLGDFTTSTSLRRWLQEVSGEGDWSVLAARHVLSMVNSR